MPPPEPSDAAGRPTFPRSCRLSGKLAFGKVFDEGVKVSRGPLAMYVLANGLGHARLGLTVSRRVGRAHERVYLKRLLREAFRHERHGLGGVDLVIVPRRHRPWPLADYRRRLAELATRGLKSPPRPLDTAGKPATDGGP